MSFNAMELIRFLPVGGWLSIVALLCLITLGASLGFWQMLRWLFIIALGALVAGWQWESLATSLRHYWQRDELNPAMLSWGAVFTATSAFLYLLSRLVPPPQVEQGWKQRNKWAGALVGTASVLLVVVAAPPATPMPAQALGWQQGWEPFALMGLSEEETKPGEALPQQERQLFALLNTFRKQEGKPALVWSDSLAKVARLHSADMQVRNYFAHTNPEGETPFERIQKMGLSYTMAGENLARARDAADAHEALQQSPRHRANMLEEKFTKVGIGVVLAANGQILVTQVFLR